MKTMKHVKRIFLPATLLLLGLSLFTSQASAHVFDFLHGQKAAAGSELHALGTTALATNNGKATYFTNGKGRVLNVHAKRVEDGTLRVTVQRVYIPKNFIADTYKDTLKAEELYNRISHMDQGNTKVGEYTLLSNEDGMDAFHYGEFVARELDNERD